MCCIALFADTVCASRCKTYTGHPTYRILSSQFTKFVRHMIPNTPINSPIDIANFCIPYSLPLQVPTPGDPPHQQLCRDLRSFRCQILLCPGFCGFCGSGRHRVIHPHLRPAVQHRCQPGMCVAFVVFILCFCFCCCVDSVKYELQVGQSLLIHTLTARYKPFPLSCSSHHYFICSLTDIE